MFSEFPSAAFASWSPNQKEIFQVHDVSLGNFDAGGGYDCECWFGFVLQMGSIGVYNKSFAIDCGREKCVATPAWRIILGTIWQIAPQRFAWKQIQKQSLEQL